MSLNVRGRSHTYLWCALRPSPQVSPDVKRRLRSGEQPLRMPSPGPERPPRTWNPGWFPHNDATHCGVPGRKMAASLNVIECPLTEAPGSAVVRIVVPQRKPWCLRT